MGVNRRRNFLFATFPKTFSNSVMLSRSRFMAPATRSLRFYREYFTPDQEIEVDKLRKRWRIEYEGADIAINLDGGPSTQAVLRAGNISRAIQGGTTVQNGLVISNKPTR